MEKKLWFRAKTYGWGWTPSSWEGWLIAFLYVGGIFFYVREVIDKQLNGDFGAPFYYHAFPVVATALLVWACYAKGEKPGWRWGKK